MSSEAENRTRMFNSTAKDDILVDLVWVINKLSVGDNNQIQLVIDSGFVPKLIPLLSHKEVEVKTGALTAISNIVTGTEKQTQVVLNCGAFFHFAALLSHQEKEINVLALRSLSSILAGNEQQVQAVIDAGLLPEIVEKLSEGEFQTQRLAVQAVTNLSKKGTKEQVTALLNSGIMPSLCNLLGCKNTEFIDILVDILWVINKLSVGVNDQIQMVIESGIVPKLIPLLSHQEVKVQTAALKAIDNIVNSTEEHIQVVLNCGALSHIPALLSHQEKEICELAVLFLANILSGNEQQVQAVIDAGLLPKIVEKLDESEFEIQRHAVQAVTNLSSEGTKEQIAALVDCDVIPTLSNLLDCKNMEADTLVKIVSTVGDIIYRSVDRTRVMKVNSIVPKLIPLLSHKEVCVETAALSAIGNIVTGIEEHRQIVLDCGALSHIPALLSHQEKEICELALRFLVNILSGNEQQVQAVIDAGLLPKIVEKLAKDNLQIQGMAVRAVYNFCCKSTDKQVAALIECGVTPALCKLLSNEDTKDTATLVKIVSTVWKILLVNRSVVDITQAIKVVIESGIVPKIIPLLSHEELKVQTAALHVAGIIITYGTEEQKQVVLNCGALSHFTVLISHQDKNIRLLAVCFLANTLAMGEQQVKAVIDAGLLPKIMEKLDEDELETQRFAVRAVYNIIHKSKQQVSGLIDCAIPALCKLLSCEDTDIIKNVLVVLRKMLEKAGENVHQLVTIIEECGGVDKIEELQIHDSVEIYKQAYNILIEYCDGDNDKDEILTNNESRRIISIRLPTVEEKIKRELASIDLKMLVMNADNPAMQLAAVQQCRKLSSLDKNPPTDEIIASDIFPTFMQCLSGAYNPTLQLESAWALTGIAYDTSAQIYKVIYAGAAPVFVKLLESPHDNVCEQALRALNDIIGDGPVLRDFVIELGVVKSLLSLIDSNKTVSILRQATRIIRNLCTSKDPTLPVKVIQEILPSLNTLIVNTDTDILVDIACTISCLTDTGNNHIKMVIDSGIVPNLITLLSHKEVMLQAAALSVIGNIATGTEEHIQVVLNCGALSHIPALLSHQENKICEKAVWFLSNVLSGNEQQVQTVIDAGLLPRIVEKLDKSEFLIERNALFAVTYLTRKGTKEQVGALIDCGVITPLCNLLSCEDTEAIYNVLDALSNMLEKAGENAHQLADSIQECGGLDKIEQLQNHDNVEIHEKADKMRRRTDKLIKSRRVSISHCTDEKEIKRALASADLKELVRYAANADNSVVQLAAVEQCRILLCCTIKNRPDTDEVIASGILPILVQCLSNHNSTLQHKTILTLESITCVREALVNKVVEAGAVPVLLQLLDCWDESVLRKALDVLFNIIKHCSNLRDFMNEQEFLKALLSVIKPYQAVEVLQNTARVLWGLCCYYSSPLTVEIIQEILASLNTLIVHNNTGVLYHVVRAIYCLTYARRSKDQVQLVIESGIVPNLTALLSQEKVDVLEYVLNTLANIAIRSEEQIQVVLDCGALSHIPALLSHQNTNICEHALSFVAKVMSGNEQQVQATIDAGLLPKIVEYLNKEMSLALKAMEAVTNLTRQGTREQVATLVDCGVIPALCKLLSCLHDSCTEFITNLLESLYNILEKAEEIAEQLVDNIAECGGIDKIEKLQIHEDVDIYKKAYKILIEYCDGDDEETALMRARLS